MSKTAICRGLSKWRCIHLSYDIWCQLVKDCTSMSVTIPCKRFISVHESVLERFKTLTEQAIREEKCDYNTRLPHRQATYDACRYLAMYWTYLDIIKDDKMQRYYPDAVTRRRAAKVFGYDVDENPFQMNGIYWDWEADKEEEQPMEENTVVNDDILNTRIEDLDFSTRVYNPLCRAGIRTLGDIVMKSVRQLYKIRNLGQRAIREIETALAKYDYYYMDLDSEAQKAHPERDEGSIVDICEQVVEETQPKPEMKPIVDPDEYDELYNKYQELSKAHQALVEFSDDLNAKYHAAVEIIKDLRSKINLDNRDMIDLVKLIVDKMGRDKMDWLYLTIGGITVDIHKKAEIEGAPRMSYTIRTREE